MKNNLIRATFIGLICLTLSTNLQAQGLPTAKPSSIGMDKQRLKRIDKMLLNHINKKELAGAVALVGRHGKTAYFKSFGHMNIEANIPMRDDAIFRIASMTKLITTVGFMILYEEDFFNLNDPVSNFIPELKSCKVAVPRQDGSGLDYLPQKHEMTIRDLLRHTSGLTYAFGYNHIDSLITRAGPNMYSGDLSNFILELIKLPLAWQPGTKWEYGYSTDIIGYLIEYFSGMTLDNFIDDKILHPLKMLDTGFWVDQHDILRLPNLYKAEKGRLILSERATKSRFLKKPAILSGGGGLTSTASDYARFLQMLLNEGILEGNRILGSKTVELMFANHLNGIDHNWLTKGTGFGLGMAIVEDIGINGEIGSVGTGSWAGIYNTFFFIDPKEHMFGILMTQTSPFELYNLSIRFKKSSMQSIIN
ncbi:beta-lactamase family protein [bacterium]|nr:beta-lactamase family protein [bacterium]